MHLSFMMSQQPAVLEINQNAALRQFEMFFHGEENLILAELNTRKGKKDEIVSPIFIEEASKLVLINKKKNISITQGIYRFVTE